MFLAFLIGIVFIPWSNFELPSAISFSVSPWFSSLPWDGNHLPLHFLLLNLTEQIPLQTFLFSALNHLFLKTFPSSYRSWLSSFSLYRPYPNSFSFIQLLLSIAFVRVFVIPSLYEDYLPHHKSIQIVAVSKVIVISVIKSLSRSFPKDRRFFIWLLSFRS